MTRTAAFQLVSDVPRTRMLNGSDAALWQNLAVASGYFPDQTETALAVVAAELDDTSIGQAWAVEVEGQLQASVTLAVPASAQARTLTVVRLLLRPESFDNGCAELLLSAVRENLAEERRQTFLLAVPTSETKLIELIERVGYACAGYQPGRHGSGERTGSLFYVHVPVAAGLARVPTAESLPAVAQLATLVVNHLQIPRAPAPSDHVVGYPFPIELEVQRVAPDVYEQARLTIGSADVEICGAESMLSGGFQLSSARRRQAALGLRNGQTVAGLMWTCDDGDRCVRFVDGFVTDGLSIGEMLRQALRLAQEYLNTLYVEIDLVASATRLLKTAEHLGFVPVAYFPAAGQSGDRLRDVVRMVKLNVNFASEAERITGQAEPLVRAVESRFQDQKTGGGTLNLLRSLPCFEGLGDGELLKISHLFTQKLFRQHDRIFAKGDFSHEVFVVMRGEVGICLEEDAAPVATVGSGEIFGELAILDGSLRTAFAVARQACILLVMERAAFQELTHRELHLGMVVMRNIAIDLYHRVRRGDAKLGR